MRKTILLILMVVLASYVVYASCYDDDGGLNYKQKGTCKDTNETEGTDMCMSWGLAEYYCTPANLCAAQIRTCEKCEDGVCLSKEADEILDVNKPPEVKLIILAVPGKTEVGFKADVSDPEGNMAVYTIDFGDGNKASNKPFVVHDYKTFGTFKVTITAVDPQGAKAISSGEIKLTENKTIELPKETPKETKSTETVKQGFFARIINFFKGLFS